MISRNLGRNSADGVRLAVSVGKVIYHLADSTGARVADHFWWEADPVERYWLEATDRTDLGANLRAPEVDDAGKPNWRYNLFKNAKVGDVVFHYHTPHAAIIAVSRIAGTWSPSPIVWGARGTVARSKGVIPHERPGYVMPLTGFAALARPLTLEALRQDKSVLQDILEGLNARYPGQSMYFPFELGSRPVRLLQGYAFKLPLRFVETYPELDVYGSSSVVAERGDQAVPATHSPNGRTTSGQGYGPSVEVKLAVELHAMEAATKYFVGKRYEVEDVSRTSPYDLLAKRDGEELNVEVKGTVSRGEAVLLTRNEVMHAQQHAERAVLFVLHSIVVESLQGRMTARGGSQSVLAPWRVEAGLLEPLQYKYTLPSSDVG